MVGCLIDGDCICFDSFISISECNVIAMERTLLETKVTSGCLGPGVTN